jgi:fumarate hydratase subunit beta
MRLHDYIDFHAREHPEVEFAVQGDRHITYKEALAEVNRLANAFVSAGLQVGDRVYLSGTLYTARDAAHKRIVEALERGDPPPFDLRGQVIYYVGPTPATPGRVIGSAGPTTSIRMDAYTPRLLERGLKATIGKGYRTEPVVEAMRRYKAVYLIAVGGAGALLAKRIRSARVIAYEDLGTEAVRELEVEDFPTVVANDIHGGDIFREGPKAYARL